MFLICLMINLKNTQKITVADKALYPKGQAESTILHEILHALSWEKLSVANADIIKDFETIYNHAKENSSLADTHAYTSKDEFFVALFTNSNFIKDLKNIPATDIKVYPNLFTELLDKLLNLLGVTSETTAYEQAFSIASNILKEEVTPNPESITEDAPITGEEILNFFEQMDLADLLESPQQNQLIDGKTTEEFLAEGFTPEENQEIEPVLTTRHIIPIEEQVTVQPLVVEPTIELIEITPTTPIITEDLQPIPEQTLIVVPPKTTKKVVKKHRPVPTTKKTR